MKFAATSVVIFWHREYYDKGIQITGNVTNLIWSQNSFIKSNLDKWIKLRYDNLENGGNLKTFDLRNVADLNGKENQK